MRLVPSTSSERTSVNRRASVASRRAYASAPTARGLEAPGARDDDAARQHLVAVVLADRLRLTGEQRLVDLEPVGRRARSRRPTTWSPVRISSRSSSTTSLDGDLPHLAVADDPRAGRRQHGEPVEGALGAPLLHDADQGVGHQHEPEEPVLRVAEHEDQHEHRAEDRVEPREDVRPRDLAERPARAVVGRVRRARARTRSATSAAVSPSAPVTADSPARTLVRRSPRPPRPGRP